MADNLRAEPKLPQNFKRFPSQMPCNRVGAEDVIAINTDGTEYKIVDVNNPVNEHGFLRVLRYYGGIHGGVGVNPDTYTELFRIQNDKGGFIPVIVFPVIAKGKECSIRINIDGRVTDIEIPPNENQEWRPVLGGFFPLEKQPSPTDTYAKVTFLERRTVNITNPVDELEIGNSGLYFEKHITVSFMGDVVAKNHGAYTCFSLVKFT